MTPFSDIYDLALVNINDRRLNYHYEHNPDAFFNQMESYLMRAIGYISSNLIDTSYDEEQKAFYADYDLDIINIYSTVIERLWWKDHTNVDIEISQKLQGRDQKNHSESANIKSKLNFINALKEEISQLISDYENKHLDEIYK